MHPSSLLFIALAVTVASHAGAQSTNSFAGAANCRVGGPQAAAGQTATWEGSCKDGYADGLGVLRWFKDGKPGDAYEGYLVRGIPNGPGFALTADNISYQGDFKDGQLHGKGTRTGANGSKLIGMFEAGVTTGEVDYTDDAGNHYHGGWDMLHDAPQGLGLMEYALGGRYQGAWQAGHPAGTGTITYPNGVTVTASLGENPFLSEPDPAEEGKMPRQTILDETPGNGVKRPRIETYGVPFNLPYSKLSQAEQRYVKRDYPILQEQDEPPYPIAGKQAIYKRLIQMQDILCIVGKVRLDVLVGADGVPQKVTVRNAPDAETAKITASVLMLTKFKPAVCAGQACAMSYPLNIKLDCSI